MLDPEAEPPQLHFREIDRPVPKGTPFDGYVFVIRSNRSFAKLREKLKKHAI